MVKVHRELFDRMGPAAVPAVVLDTPFGFQENADDLVAKARDYFRESVGRDIGVATFRAAGGDPLAYETMLTRLRDAHLVFSGPGSPTYALRQWRGTRVPELLREKLATGGCVTFASAAAVALGRVSLPVYEIYKAGEPLAWLDGLDLLHDVGIDAAVIPHYNNAEGGTHDTRYCYLGARRLAVMETLLPKGVFVLGIDEHTAVILDLDRATAEVRGLGALTVRVAGHSREIPAGSAVSIGELAAMGRGNSDVG
jgi:cyanophycinase-like exopeptidase